MDINKIFEVMKDNNYHHFTGNNNNHVLSFNFSTGYNCRGNAISIIKNNYDIHEKNIDLELWLGDGKDNHHKYENINNDRLFELLNKHLQ